MPTDMKNSFLRQIEEETDLTAKARKFTASLLEDLDNGEINEEYHYGESTVRGERFQLAGNGPTAYAVFLVSRDAVEGYVEFIESRTALVRIPDWAAEELYEALRSPADD